MPESFDRGALTEAVYYILLALLQPLHGYGVMQRVSEMSTGRVNLGAGTLYGALGTLQEKGWIAAVGDDGGRKKEYVTSPLGRQMLQAEIARLGELLQNGQALLGGNADVH